MLPVSVDVAPPPGTGSNCNRSPGWHCSTSHIFCNVSKRTPRTFPLLSKERFCSVIPTAAARSRERILRRASMMSSVTMIGMVVVGFVFEGR